MLPILLEVCANSLESARRAESAGVKRIELCRNLEIGGLTPSYDDIRYCVNNLSFDTYVLIRPRAGDFCYHPTEFDEILRDIHFCQSVGAKGVVVGFLHPDLSVDTEKCKTAIQAAGNMQVTFHRAFDRCLHWSVALEQIIECGFHRILTSGQRKTAEEGIDILKQIVKQADNRITILAGAGINSSNVARIIKETGVREVHGSCKTEGCMSDLNEIIRTLNIINTFNQ